MRFLLVLLLALPAMAQLGPHSFTNGLTIVDGVTGNDITAMKYRSDRSFKTLTAAKNASVAGDTIFVKPGTYLGTNLLKRSVNYWFESGAIVTNNGPSGIFDDKFTGATTNLIGGFGDFRLLMETNQFQAAIGAEGVLVVTNLGSYIILHGTRLQIRSFENSSLGTIAAVHVRNCTYVSVDVDEIVDPDFDRQSFNPSDPETEIFSTASGVYWQRGDVHISCKRMIIESGYSIWGDEPLATATNSLYYVGNLVKNKKSNCYYMSGASDNYKLWIKVIESEATEGSVISSIAGGGKLYMDGFQKISGGGSAVINNAGMRLWLTGQKATALAAHTVILDLDNGYTDASIIEYETATARTHLPAVVDVVGGTNYLHGGRLIATNGIGMKFSGSHATRVKDMVVRTVNSGNGPTNEPILSITNGLTLQNVSAIAPNASAPSVVSTNSLNPITVDGIIQLSTAPGASVVFSNGLVIVNGQGAFGVGAGAPNLDSTILLAAVSAGATAISLLNVPAGVAVGSGYLVIDVGTTNCEIRQVDTISGKTINIIGAASYPLTYAHSAGTTVLWIPDGQGVPWTWFGAKADDTSEATAAANTWGFNRLSTNLYNLTGKGPGEIIVPSGTYRIANQLWMERDLTLRGISPNVSVIAAADSFPFTTSGEVAMLHPIRDGVPVIYGAPGSSGRWFIRDIMFDGRRLANSCGVLSSPQQPDKYENVRFNDFKGLYALCLADVQDHHINNLQFLNCSISWRMRTAAMVTASRVNIEGSDIHDILVERQAGSDTASYQFKVDGLHIEPSNVSATNRSRTSNVATIETIGPHEIVVGQHVTVSGLGGTGYNATNVVVVSVPNSTNFTYSNTGGDEALTQDLGGLVQPHISHVSIQDGDGMVFDHVTISNPNTGTLFDFDVDDGLSGYPIFELRNVEAKAPTTAFNVVHDRQRNITRTTTQIGRRIQEIKSGVNTPNGWALEITGDASGGNESPPRFANGINFGAGTNVTAGPYVKAGSGSPEGVLSAPIGSIWMRTNGSGVTSVYFKESGASDAGWVNRDSGLVVNTPASSLRNVIQPSADVIGLTVDAFDAGSLQTIFRARKSDGTVVLSVNPNGRVGVGTAGANYPFEVVGQMNVNGISLDDGTAVTGILTGQAELDFDLSAAAVHDLTITVTGAADGDNVILGIPTGSTGAEWDFTQPWVSAANTVKVRARRISGTPNPASGNFRAVIIKW